jgi:hypothetical protein
MTFDCEGLASTECTYKILKNHLTNEKIIEIV